MLYHHGGTAALRGSLWGERLWRSRQSGRLAGDWPAWSSERAVNVRRKCQALVEDLATGDARLLEALGQLAADAARRVYEEGPLVAGAPAFVAEGGKP